MNYFSPSRGGIQTVQDALSGAITVTKYMPVVLQHAGHSRTVVGYEIQKNGECNLLVFDPARCVRSAPPSTSSRGFPCSTTRSVRSPLRTAALGTQDGLGTNSHAPRDKRLAARIKDTILHPITEMKARKRKASPGVIDLTCPTQKRPRSTSSNDVVVVDEDPETLQPAMIGGESESGRSPSVEIQDEGSLTRGAVMKDVLNWSRLSMKHIRSASKDPSNRTSADICAGRRTNTKSSTSLSQPLSRMRRSHKERSLQASNCDTVLPTNPGFLGRPCSCFVSL